MSSSETISNCFWFLTVTFVVLLKMLFLSRFEYDLLFCFFLGGSVGFSRENNSEVEQMSRIFSIRFDSSASFSINKQLSWSELSFCSLNSSKVNQVLFKFIVAVG